MAVLQPESCIFEPCNVSWHKKNTLSDLNTNSTTTQYNITIMWQITIYQITIDLSGNNQSQPPFAVMSVFSKRQNCNINTDQPLKCMDLEKDLEGPPQNSTSQVCLPRNQTQTSVFLLRLKKRDPHAMLASLSSEAAAFYELGNH